ncbi:hypothetical protein LVY75_25620 [Sinorhizobium sp. B11]
MSHITDGLMQAITEMLSELSEMRASEFKDDATLAEFIDGIISIRDSMMESGDISQDPNRINKGLRELERLQSFPTPSELLQLHIPRADGVSSSVDARLNAIINRARSTRDDLSLSRPNTLQSQLEAALKQMSDWTAQLGRIQSNNPNDRAAQDAFELYRQANMYAEQARSIGVYEQPGGGYLQSAVGELAILIQDSKFEELRSQPLMTNQGRAIAVDEAVGVTYERLNGILNSILAQEGADRETAAYHVLGTPIPAPKIAPFRFELSGTRVVVSKTYSFPESPDAASVEAALDYLEETAAQLKEWLAGSNSPRVQQTFEAVVRRLLPGASAIQLGLASEAYRTSVIAAQEELAADLHARLLSFSQAVSDYAAQFPDWQRFSENAAQLSIEDAPVRELAAGFEELGSRLRAVDPENEDLASTVEEVASWGRIKKLTGKIKLAIARTWENILIPAIGRYVRTVVDGIVDIAAEATIATILVLAIGFFEPLSMLPGNGWMIAALTVLQKAYKK